MPTFGTLTIHLALLAHALACPIFLRAGRHGGSGLRAARALTAAAAALLTTATALLALAAVVHDFRIEYIASYTDRTTPITYLATAVWAGQAGSLLVWACMLAWIPVLLSGRLKRAAPSLEPVTLGALVLLACLLEIVIVGWSSPFTIIVGRELVDGSGLNPLLRNILMVVHPPALLAGYVAYAAPAAISVGALATGRLDRSFLTELRRWALVAWVLLTVGNALGMVWAYGELGWGGYWGWDPVENASLIPWLVGTALLHAIVLEERAKGPRGFAAILSLLAFWLTILGTYLTRSGVVASVHAFGRTAVGDALGVLLAVLAVAIVAAVILRRKLIDWPSRAVLLPLEWATFAVFILAFSWDRLPEPYGIIVGPAVLTVGGIGWALCSKSRGSFPRAFVGLFTGLVVGGVIDPLLWGPGALAIVVVALVAWRAGAWGGAETAAKLLSRRSLLIAATLAILALAGGVLLGTLLPLGSQLIAGRPAQVGPEWYNAWAAPAGLVLIALTGLGVSLGWKRPSLGTAWKGMALPLAAGAAGALAAVVTGVTNGLAIGAVALAALTGMAAILELRTGGPLSRRAGAAFAHGGLALLFLGISGEADKVEEDLSLARGEPASLGDFVLRLDELDQRSEVEREVLEAAVIVEREGKAPRTLFPARHLYRSHSEQPTSEAAWITSVTGDLFLTLGHVDVEGGRAGVRAVVTPLLLWIWIGSTLLALGGIIALAFLLRPSKTIVIGVSLTIALVVGLWIFVRPAPAFAALAALSLGLTLVWLGQGLIRPLWGLQPVEKPDDDGDRDRDQSREGDEDRDGACPGCGAKLVSDSLFCHKCGARVDDA